MSRLMVSTIPPCGVTYRFSQLHDSLGSHRAYLTTQRLRHLEQESSDRVLDVPVLVALGGLGDLDHEDTSLTQLLGLGEDHSLGGVVEEAQVAVGQHGLTGEHVGLVDTLDGRRSSTHAGTHISDVGMVPGADFLRALDALDPLVTAVRRTSDGAVGQVVLHELVVGDDGVDVHGVLLGRVVEAEQGVVVLAVGLAAADAAGVVPQDLLVFLLALGVTAVLQEEHALITSVVDDVGLTLQLGDGDIEAVVTVVGIDDVHDGVLLDVDVDGLAVDELGVVGTAQVDGLLCPRGTGDDLHMGLGKGV